MRTLSNPRVNKTFEALFALEDIRQIFRESLPSGLTEAEELALKARLAEVRKDLDAIESPDGQGQKYTGKIGVPGSRGAGIDVRTREEEYINIHPIQAAGRLTPEARKAIIAYGDGYSTCDYCRKPFRLDKITKPAILDFHGQLAQWLNMDQARVVPGARRGFQAAVSAVAEKGDSVIVSALAHYTEFLAVEQAGAVVKEVPKNEKNIITAEATAQKIEEVRQKTGKLPVLIMIDHFDYMFANEHDVYGIAKVAKQYGIPFLYNGAYTVGIAPVDGKKIGADFVVGSGHKSMASVAPSGVLATTNEYAAKVFRTTQMVGDVTNRKFGIKEVENMGCTLMGGTLLSMMASFPTVVERSKHWDEEVKKSNYFLEQFQPRRGQQRPQRVAEEAHADQGRHDEQLQQGGRNPQAPRVLLQRRAPGTRRHRRVRRRHQDLEAEHLRAVVGQDKVPERCVPRHREEIRSQDQLKIQ